jgi:NitT/TauT family transport system substrate-binding protein
MRRLVTKVAGLSLAFMVFGALVLVGGALTSCSAPWDNANSGNNSNAEPNISPVNIVVPDGAPLLNFAFLGKAAEDAGNGKYKITGEGAQFLERDTFITRADGPDALAASMQKDSPDIAIVAVNMAAKLYNATDDASKQYKMLGITTWGLNEIVGQNELAGGIADLKGKKLYSFGKSETPGIVLRTLLKNNDIAYVDSTSDELAPDVVNIVDLATAQDIVAALIKDKQDGNNDSYALLPEPAASALDLKTDSAYSVQLNLSNVWGQTFGYNQRYPQSALIVRSDFLADAGNQKFLSILLERLGVTTGLVVNDPSGSALNMVENFGSTALANTDAVSKSIAGKRLVIDMGTTYDGSDVSERNRELTKSYLEQILNFSDDSAKLVGGKVPDDEFFAQVQVPK